MNYQNIFVIAPIIVTKDETGQELEMEKLAIGYVAGSFV